MKLVKTNVLRNYYIGVIKFLMKDDILTADEFGKINSYTHLLLSQKLLVKRHPVFVLVPCWSLLFYSFHSEVIHNLRINMDAFLLYNIIVYNSIFNKMVT